MYFSFFFVVCVKHILEYAYFRLAVCLTTLRQFQPHILPKSLCNFDSECTTRFIPQFSGIWSCMSLTPKVIFSINIKRIVGEDSYHCNMKPAHYFWDLKRAKEANISVITIGLSDTTYASLCLTVSLMSVYLFVFEVTVEYWVYCLVT